MLFFTINLYSVKSNQISTYRKLNLPLTSSIYLVFLSVEMQKKTRTDQSIPLVFLLCLKGNHLQVFKSGNCKKPSTPVCMLLVQLASMNVFFFYVITGWCYFSWKFVVTVRLFKRQWRQCFERNPYFTRYLHNNNMMVDTKFPK